MLQILLQYLNHPDRFCASFAEAVMASLHVDVDTFLQVSMDKRSWPSVLLLSLLSDYNGVRAAVFLLPSCQHPNILRLTGATFMEDDNLWLLPSRFNEPIDQSHAHPVPVHLYALAFGFYVYPLNAKVYDPMHACACVN